MKISRLLNFDFILVLLFCPIVLAIVALHKVSQRSPVPQPFKHWDRRHTPPKSVGLLNSRRIHRGFYKIVVKRRATKPNQFFMVNSIICYLKYKLGDTGGKEA